MRWTLIVGLVGVVASVVVFWFAPLLGALMLIGTVGGIGIAVVPASIGRIATWLSTGSFRRSRWIQ